MQNPPGGFIIVIQVSNGDWNPVQTTSCNGTPGCMQFKGDAMNYIAKEMMDFLKANKLPRSSFAECVSVIDSFTCTRLGNDKQWCYDTDKAVAATSPTVLGAQGKCSSCGTPRP